MITQPQLIDITNVITKYSETLPTLFTDVTQEAITSVLYNIEIDDEGHTSLGILIDPINSSLILIETESGSFSLNAKYQMAGIATLNNLSFSIDTVDTCVACDLGMQSEALSIDDTTDTTVESTKVVH
jgi:hypothetical protein